MPVGSFDDGDDDERDSRSAGRQGGRPLKDWDCPACDANNPSDEVVGPDGLDARCNYCGVEFKISLSDGRLKFKEI